jgi:hypothetical protein
MPNNLRRLIDKPVYNYDIFHGWVFYSRNKMTNLGLLIHIVDLLDLCRGTSWMETQERLFQVGFKFLGEGREITL